MTYRILRIFQDSKIERQLVAEGLTLAQAQAHCNDPQTSSKSCTTGEGQAITDACGPWFDGYFMEGGEGKKRRPHEARGSDASNACFGA